VDVDKSQEAQIPICENECKSGCGDGCIDYWYVLPKKGMIPPIGRNSLAHLLQTPEKFGRKRGNRNALPRRRDILVLSEEDSQKYGWGLHFVEAVWFVPIRLVQIASVIVAVALLITYSVKHEPKISTVLSSMTVIGIGQSIAKLMEYWAKSNLAEKPK
jgi:hypothetical protein